MKRWVGLAALLLIGLAAALLFRPEAESAEEWLRHQGFDAELLHRETRPGDIDIIVFHDLNLKEMNIAFLQSSGWKRNGVVRSDFPLTVPPESISYKYSRLPLGSTHLAVLYGLVTDPDVGAVEVRIPRHQQEEAMDIKIAPVIRSSDEAVWYIVLEEELTGAQSVKIQLHGLKKQAVSLFL
ncbi:hypothetical protein WJ0W_001765 [Paenibacillus melissococcoides]|uniref:Uncharacterized protein n=1 Tax=Paenibacillus melissococcoides TaxID=2912268 RepID=A0ABM9FZ36_9BACL|nr:MULTISPECIES: hypothetical protein [Paenibacillus]MEB9894324.1 hypothetical protein [Bacillus cereus]CAH8244531.1 hypothetical protein WJ0W_001765 [Paenibacillus melissococcoides]CAH8708259.1 hypothetical protein WDD9_001852 [Paenibacillus melissococcoides]CAH8708966.1 hypothetical protein HTL2_002137 [Paenibacillus melissococcoides]GIO78373.1 hypothetical protein J6TS7_19830 [Paenibacillus dendritiformis]